MIRFRNNTHTSRHRTSRPTNRSFEDQIISSNSRQRQTQYLPIHNPFTSSLPHPDASPDPPSPCASPPPGSDGGLAVVRAKLQVVRAVLQRGVPGAARPVRLQQVLVLPSGVVVLQLHARLLAGGPAGPGVLRPVRAELPLLHRRAVLRQRHHYRAS